MQVAGFSGKVPTTPQPIKQNNSLENLYEETYRSLQVVKLLYKEAFAVRLKPLVRTKGDPSTLPEDYLIMVKKKKKNNMESSF